MANSWRKGHLGLEPISGVNKSLSELSQSFNDNLSASYDDKDIPNETINHLLEKSWKATSSKNNFMAYKIHVLDNTKKFEIKGSL